MGFKIAIDRGPGLVTARVGQQLLLDLLSFLAGLNDVPADPEGKAENNKEPFRALEGVDGANVPSDHPPSLSSPLVVMVLSFAGYLIMAFSAAFSSATATNIASLVAKSRPSSSTRGGTRSNPAPSRIFARI